MKEKSIKVEAWWNAVKGSGLWTGSAKDLSWDELWPSARRGAEDIFDKAINPAKLENGESRGMKSEKWLRYRFDDYFLQLVK